MWVLPVSRIDGVPGASAEEGAPSGFSLIELLVGVALFFVVLLGVFNLYEAGQWTFWRAETQADVQQDVRLALEHMRREMRMAGYDPSATGQAAVQNPTDTSVEFITGRDATTSTLVKYDWDSTTRAIRRTVKSWNGTGWGVASVTTLARNVEGLAFQYFPSAAVPGLTRIRITIQGARSVPRQPTQRYQVTTDVFLRNL